jgi:hypothetical protein
MRCFDGLLARLSVRAGAWRALIHFARVCFLFCSALAPQAKRFLVA